MKKKIIAGNWKMNHTLEEAISLTNEILSSLAKLKKENQQSEIILCIPFVYLNTIFEQIQHSTFNIQHLKLGAQNCHWENQGAYTGEISAGMLKSVGVEYVIIGHSERRHYFNETNKMLSKKINLCLQQNLIPIYCCGENLETRNKNQHFQLIQQQITEALFHLEQKDFSKIIIAYEPVWAIGTGVNATPQQAQEAHHFIRTIIAAQYGNTIVENISILYGGSCKPDNAAALFAQPDVDGGLIGGASLKADDFVKICLAL